MARRSHPTPSEAPSLDTALSEIQSMVAGIVAGDASVVLDENCLPKEHRQLASMLNQLAADHLRRMKEASTNVGRVEGLVESLARLAQLDFTPGSVLPEDNDMFAAVNMGINMLGEELQANVISKRYLENVITVLPEGLLILDVSFTIVSANKAAQRLLRKPLRKLLSQSIRTIFPADTDVDALLMVPLTANDAINGQEATVVRGRQRIPVLLSAATSDVTSQRDANFIVVLADITQQKQTLRELESKNNDLLTFATAASHDLREPIRKIHTFADMLLQNPDGTLGEGPLDYIRRILDASQRMRSLVDDLLAYSKITIDTQPPEKMDLNLLITDVLADLELRVVETSARVTVSRLPTVFGRPIQLYQLFQNLITNAIKFQDKENPTVRIYNRLDDTPQEHNRVHIAVQDNGIGIAEEHQEKIFSLFRRLHGRREYSGSGIGLAVCQRVVERHNGRIWVESEPGHGATFTVALPEEEDAK